MATDVARGPRGNPIDGFFLKVLRLPRFGQLLHHHISAPEFCSPLVRRGLEGWPGGGQQQQWAEVEGKVWQRGGARKFAVHYTILFAIQ